jgi:hypothetical protein
MVCCMLLASCGTHRRLTAPPPASTSAPHASRLPTPPLDPGHLPPPRAGSAGNLQFDSGDVFDFTDNGETGDKGDGTFAVLPGGEDDLDSAWVIFTIQLAADDRPVSIGLGSALATLPGGEDDLELSYWLGAYSFSQARWDWLDPPSGSGDPLRLGAWNALGSVPVGMNGAQLRQRYCNLGGEVYFCVLVEPKSRTGAWCGVTVQPSTLEFANKDEAGFEPTEPLPASVASATPDTADSSVTLDIIETDPGEAERTYIQRRQTSGTSAARGTSNIGWIELGYLNTGDTTFIDPTDTTNQEAFPPLAGMSYEYRAVAAVLDVNRALRATYSNSSTVQLGNTWRESQLAAGMSINGIALAVINGQPAVAYCDHNQGTSRVNYQSASTVDGADAGDWSAPVELDASTSNLDGDVELEEVNGTPAVCYVDHADRTLRYQRCTIPDGTDVSDWPVSPVVINFPGVETVRDHSFAVIADHPAVAYKDSTPGGPDEGVYVWSTTVGGDSAGNWAARAVLAGTQSFDWPSLADLNGSPGISFYQSNGAVVLQSLNFIHATTPTGAQTSDWPAPLELLSGGGSYFPTLLSIDSRPTIVYRRNLPTELGFIGSTTPQGDQLSDWSQQFTFPEPVQWDPGAANAAIFANSPILANQPVVLTPSPQQEILYFQSSTPDGSDIADWSSEETELFGTYVTVAEVDGKVAIAYRDSSGAPTYAIMQ